MIGIRSEAGLDLGRVTIVMEMNCVSSLLNLPQTVRKNSKGSKEAKTFLARWSLPHSFGSELPPLLFASAGVEESLAVE